MKKFSSTTFIIFISGLLFSTIVVAQNDDSIIDSFENYTELPREIAYVHLNKSTYIKGEIIGLSAYVLDKDTKKPYGLTTNLYCTVSNAENKVIKSQLIKVKDGFAYTSFEVDSVFTSGEYVVKAYTNWMKNFEEQNLFIESIKVIDPAVEQFIKPQVVENVIDAQFLPEGGHLLADVQNTMGVVIKNTEGFGVPFISGEVYDNKNNYVTSFKTNKLGLGRFLLTPSIENRYTVKLEHLGNTSTFSINDIKPKGVSIAINDLNDQVAVTLKTNTNTFSSIKNKPFRLSMHNGAEIKIIDFNFDEKKITLLIEYKDLHTGINIFTLFDDQNNPILERLFFKSDGINIIKSGKIAVQKTQDSLSISIPFQQLNTNIASNISVSVLPASTKAYNRNHNIISYTYLQPYINGQIENAAYYFNTINRKSKFELDNLLITQGWSSYDWNTIFNAIPTNTFPFENGIGFKANVNKVNSNQFLMYGLEESNGDLLVLEDGEKAFVKIGLYPKEREEIKIGEIKKNGRMQVPNMYLQFNPSKIPTYNTNYKTQKTNSYSLTETTEIKPIVQATLDKTQKLDEILITANKEKIRAKKLQDASYGKLKVFSDKDRDLNTSLANYLRKNALRASVTNGILNLSWFTPRLKPPAVFVNDQLILDYGLLADLDMRSVDYIEINKYDVRNVPRNNDGTIKIYTDLNIILRKKYDNKYKIFNFPLTFSDQKKYYIPKYPSYSDPFFNQYGIIGWTPKATIENNSIVMSIFDTKTEQLKLIIEGMDVEGHIISEEKIITLN
jgi:hypothetical protein